MKGNSIRIFFPGLPAMQVFAATRLPGETLAPFNFEKFLGLGREGLLGRQALH
jgi:hypothetical protein